MTTSELTTPENKIKRKMKSKKEENVETVTLDHSLEFYYS